MKITKHTLRTAGLSFLVAGILAALFAIISPTSPPDASADTSSASQVDSAAPAENSKEVLEEKEARTIQVQPKQEGQGQTTSFEVKDEDNAESISQRLAEAGLVDDAKEYQEFLTANGYHEKLVAGQYDLNDQMSYKDIAESLTQTADQS